jgi:hypothetical protein
MNNVFEKNLNQKFKELEENLNQKFNFFNEKIIEIYEDYEKQASKRKGRLLLRLEEIDDFKEIIINFCKTITEIKFNILKYRKIFRNKYIDFRITIYLCDVNFSFNEYSIISTFTKYDECNCESTLYKNTYSIIKCNPISILNKDFIELLRLKNIDVIFNNTESINLQILKYLIILVNLYNNKNSEYLNHIHKIKDLDNNSYHLDLDNDSIKIFFNRIIFNFFKQRKINLKIIDNLYFSTLKYILPLLKITEADVLNSLFNKLKIPNDIITIISTFLGFPIFYHTMLPLPSDSYFWLTNRNRLNNEITFKECQFTFKVLQKFVQTSNKNEIKFHIYDGNCLDGWELL